MTWVKLTYQRRRVRICVQPISGATEGATDRMTWVKLTYQRRRVRICVQPVSGEPETLINTRRKKLYTLGYQK